MSNPTIYIGENLKKFDLKANRIYRDYPAEKIAELKKICPAAEKLFVPAAEFLKKSAAMKNSASPESIAMKILKG